MIERLEFFLADRGIYMLALILMAVGVYGMISCGNYMKKLICMNIMQVAIIFFFLTLGRRIRRHCRFCLRMSLARIPISTRCHTR